MSRSTSCRVRLVPLEPPGTHCQHQAVFDALRRVGGRTFVEVGCGDGSLCAKLCERGYRGLGIDFAETALEVARGTAVVALDEGRLELRLADVMEDGELIQELDRFDIALSMMVMEHVEREAVFLERMTDLVKAGGHLLVGVPGRMDHWGVEDEQVGHLRRYERGELAEKLETAGLEDVVVWSVSVPVANLLYPLGNLLLRRQRAVTSQLQQTKESGIRPIPMKTAFPSFFRVVLNPWTLYPLFLTQRLFYQTSLGLTLLGFGRKAA